MSLEDFKTDSAVYKFTVKDSGIAEDISTWQIIAEFGDNTLQIRKGTSNVTGGSDNQILITDGPGGKFEVYLDKNETSSFADVGYLEVASLVGSDKDTLFFSNINFKDVKIDWETVT